MNWKNELKALEQSQRWDDAIAFMEKIISKNLDDVDAYLYMNYLLMNLLAEENSWDREDEQLFAHYEALAKKYFDESYKKFCDNAEFLYYTAHTTVMSPWFFGLDQKDYLAMFDKARLLAPNNTLYQSNYYFYLDWNFIEQKREAEKYAQRILQEGSLIQQELKAKGLLGEYVLGMLVSWAEDALDQK